MGIFTYIKMGLGIVAILAAGYFVLNYRHMQTKIAAQALVIEQQQEALEYYQESAQIDVDTAKQKEELHEIINSRDPQRIRDYFKRMRNLSTGNQGN